MPIDLNNVCTANGFKYCAKQKLSIFHVLSIFLYHVFIAFALRTQESPDEWWQSAEVAYYLVFGKGELTWEWREGIRSVCFPLLYAIPFYLLKITGLDTAFTVYAIERVVQAIIASGISCTVFKLGAIIDCALDEDLKYLGSNTSKNECEPLSHLKDILHSIKTCSCRNVYRTVTSLIITPSVAWTALYFSLMQWYFIYCGVRAYSNVAEALFVMLALIQVEREHCFLAFANVACMLRVTSVIMLFPIYVYHIARLARGHGRRRALSYLAQTCLFVALAIPFMAALDYIFYRRWIFTPLRFYKYNISMNISTFYGTHAWGWYFCVGVPVIVGPHILLLSFLKLVLNHLSKSLIVRRRSKAARMVYLLLALFLWSIFLNSFVAHKEMRFIYPTLPIAIVLVSFVISCSVRLDKMNMSVKTLAYLLRKAHIFFLLVNLLLLVIFCYGYRCGSLTVMSRIRKSPVFFPRVDVITPCHTTPGYAQIHGKVGRFRTLDCSMTLHPLLKTPQITEDILFREKPELFVHWCYRRTLPKKIYDAEVEKQPHQMVELLSNMEKFFPANETTPSMPDGIVMFTYLAEKLRKDFLEPHNYTLHTRAFHAIKSLEPYEGTHMDFWVKK